MAKYNTRTLKGFTLIELLIAAAILGILTSVIVGAFPGKGISEKAQCLQSGGQWTEGIQYGRYTALCTFGKNSGS